MTCKAFVVAVFATVLVVPACRKKQPKPQPTPVTAPPPITIILTANCSDQSCTVTANPQEYHLSGEAVQVTWQAGQNGQAWLVNFGSGTPCEGGTQIFQSSGTTSCTVPVTTQNICFAYVAVVDGAKSPDPFISHSTGGVSPCAHVSPPVTGRPSYCLDLAVMPGRSPGYCGQGRVPTSGSTDPLSITRNSYVTFRGSANASITFDEQLCSTGGTLKLPGVCFVPSTATARVYAYTLSSGGTFHVQVQ